MTSRRGLALLLVVILLAAPIAEAGKKDKKKRRAGKKNEKGQVQVILAQAEIPREALLDVGIQVLDPGIPEAKDEDDLEAKGIFEDVRKSEARFIAFHLKATLEMTGQWGAVRMVPDGSDTADVIIDGEIMASDGRMLGLAVVATDSTGRVWLQKRYKRIADAKLGYGEDVVDRRDPFQNLYNQIANDLVGARGKLDRAGLEQIREITQLRFAADLAPLAYDEYLTANRKGRVSIDRLPADDDPMMDRIERIRERDYLFIDTLNEHYAEFYTRMSPAYEEWRRFSFEEAEALRELKRESMVRKIVGGLLFVGGIVTGGGGATAARVMRDAAVVGGGYAFKKGMEMSKEAKIHREALRELAQSFDAEMSPLLVDVEGQTMRLEGSAEGQYANWRKLLREIFLNETGLPQNPNQSAALDATGGSHD